MESSTQEMFTEDAPSEKLIFDHLTHLGAIKTQQIFAVDFHLLSFFELLPYKF
jgi:hypothetical protein